jgi:hypothetical protein
MRDKNRLLSLALVGFRLQACGGGVADQRHQLYLPKRVIVEVAMGSRGCGVCLMGIMGERI